MNRIISILLTLFLIMPFADLSAQVSYTVFVNQMDLMMGNSAPYEGKSFIYLNRVKYDGNMVMPPFPFESGRLRSGKYKASQSAMEEYIGSLKQLKGNVMKFVGIQTVESMPYIILSADDGTQYAFGNSILADLLCSDAEAAAKSLVGKTVYAIQCQPMVFAAPYGFYEIPYGMVEEKTGKRMHVLPYLSTWKVTSYKVDFSYFGDHSMVNDAINTQLIPIKFTIENPNYGKYVVYWNYFMNGGPDNAQAFTISFPERYTNSIYFSGYSIQAPYPAEDIAKFSEWAKKGYIEAAFIKEFYIDLKMSGSSSSNRQASESLINAAKSGYLPALHELTYHSYKNVYPSVILQVINDRIGKNVANKKQYVDLFSNLKLRILEISDFRNNPDYLNEINNIESMLSESKKYGIDVDYVIEEVRLQKKLR